jgi:hypothetical protein
MPRLLPMSAMLLIGAALAAAEGPATSARAADLPADFVAEAPFAAGWPAPRTAGEIDDTTLPAFRAVEHEDFTVLFRYITTNRIPMTAPVTYPMVQPKPGDETAQRARRFLMPAPDSKTGELPTGAKLVDVPAQRVLRLSYRGGFDNARISTALTTLMSEATSRGLQAAGVPTLAGYNNPMRAEAEQTYEVILPVRAAGEQPAK